jgi:hypothetical protein
VPQVVKPYRREPRFLQELLQLPSQLVNPQVPARVIGKYQPFVIPLVRFEAHFQLPEALLMQRFQREVGEWYSPPGARRFRLVAESIFSINAAAYRLCCLPI